MESTLPHPESRSQETGSLEALHHQSRIRFHILSCANLVAGVTLGKNGAQKWEHFGLKEKRSSIPTHSTHTHTHTHTPPPTQDNCCSHIISSSFALNGARLNYPFAQPQWRRPRAGLELVYREKRYETKLPGGGEAEEWREGRIETGNQEQTELSSWNCVTAFEKAVVTPSWWIHIHKQKQR